MPLDSKGRLLARGDTVELVSDRSRGTIIGFPVDGKRGTKVLVRTDDGFEVSVPLSGIRLLEPRCLNDKVRG